MDLSVVIPVYNEAENVAPLINEVIAAIPDKLAFEIVMVDDCSTDETYANLKSLRVRDKRVRIIRHATNAGQSTAIMNGVKAARADWVATLDGDGQNDPADIPVLFSALDTLPSDKPGVICGWRTKRHDSWLRKLSSRIANGVRSALLGDATPDTGCGLKLFPRYLFLELPTFNHMHRFLPALFQRQGAHVISVPVNHRPRARGVSKYGVHNRLWVGIVDLIGVMWLQRRAKHPDVSEVD